MINVPVVTILSRAYAATSPTDMAGLPDWASRERYDVSATSSLSAATTEDRIAMLRSMLADRFKLVVHFEKRKQPVFELMLSRTNGTLGPGIKPSETDCSPQAIAARNEVEAVAARGIAPQPPDFKAPPPPCTLRTLDPRMRDHVGDGLGRLGDLLEADTTMAELAVAFRRLTGRVVVDKTGLPGSYRVAMNFDVMASRRGPEVAPPTGPAVVAPLNEVPSIFSAVVEQLGLRLRSARAEGEALVIDRLERPTEN